MGMFFTIATRTYVIGLIVCILAAKAIEIVEECKKDETFMKFWNNFKKDLGFKKREAKNV